MADTVHLRVRVSDATPGRDRSIEVLDPDDNVLGDLAMSVTQVRYKMGFTGDVSIVSLDLAVERAHIDSIEGPSNKRGS